MSESHDRKRTTPLPEPGRSARESASTADGIVAERAALADRERRTAAARTAARRLDEDAEPRR